MTYEQQKELRVELLRRCSKKDLLNLLETEDFDRTLILLVLGLDTESNIVGIN